jgi:2-aminoadipate transaminase
MEKTFYFTGGKTPPETFPTDALALISQKAIKKIGGAFAFYPRQHEYSSYSDLGYKGLREVVSLRYKRREGVALPIDNIVVTSGSMQAIELVGRALLKPGDIIITEELTYYGSLEFFRYLKLNVIGIPVDDKRGMEIDILEDTLKCFDRLNLKPKIIYTIPNHHNPTGAIMTEKRRKRLLDLAYSYNIPIFEDDCYGDIDFYKDRKPRSINTLDDEGNVLFVGSFSKILGPGIRLGYLYAKDNYLNTILSHRWDLGTSVLASIIVAEYLKEKMWDHLEKHIKVIKRKMDITLKALGEYAGEYTKCTPPRGGLFIWVKITQNIDMEKLSLYAERRNVKYDEGKLFHYRERELKALRLSYAHIPDEEIPIGIKRLSEAIREAII